MPLEHAPWIDSAFYPAIVAVARELAPSRPPVDAALDFASILWEESGINPTIRNGIGCVGINQFCGSETRGDASSTYQAFVRDSNGNVIPKVRYLAFPASVQLSFVARFWADKVRRYGEACVSSARDLLWVNFVPAWYVAGAGDAHVITSDPVILGANLTLVSADPARLAERGSALEALKRITAARRIKQAPKPADIALVRGVLRITAGDLARRIEDAKRDPQTRAIRPAWAQIEERIRNAAANAPPSPPSPDDSPAPGGASSAVDAARVATSHAAPAIFGAVIVALAASIYAHAHR